MALIKNRLSLLVMFSCLGVLGAIGWQSLYGHRNFEFQKHLALTADESQKALASVVEKRVAMETRVALLLPGTIDSDLVDEIARRDLNMGGKNDIIAKVSN